MIVARAVKFRFTCDEDDCTARQWKQAVAYCDHENARKWFDGGPVIVAETQGHAAELLSREHGRYFDVCGIPRKVTFEIEWIAVRDGGLSWPCVSVTSETYSLATP